MSLPADPRVSGFSGRLVMLIAEESVRSFARRCGFSEGVIRNYLRGDSYPTLDRLAVLASVGGCSIEWLSVGNQPSVNESVLTVLPYRFDGQEGEGSALVGLNLEWAKGLAESSDSLLTQVVADDAVAPLIKQGDLVVVDISRRRWDDPGIYLFELEGRWVARRIELLLSGGIRIFGDSGTYSEQLVSVEEYQSLNILGRVVWAGGAV